jgi:gas vesicle protein
MIEDPVVLLGGALLGAAAMYFLDPEIGRRRRERIAAAAGHLPDEARSALHSGTKAAERWFGRAQDAYSHAHDAAQGYVGDAAKNIDSHAHEHLSHLRDMGSHLWSRARGLVHHVPEIAAEQARHLRDELADRSDDLRRRAAHRISQRSHRVQSWLGHEEHTGFGAGTLLSSTAGCCAVGAGLMYFLDSGRGRQRRAWVADKTMNCIHRTGKAMRSIGEMVSDRLHGVESAGRTFKSRIDSEQLIRRIRSELSGMAIGQVQFMADGDGTVTVTGNIRPDDLDGLLTELHRIPGVEHVINRLVINWPRSNQSASGASAMPR